MKAITIAQNGIELREIKLETLPQGWAKIRVTKSGLCGTDVAKILAPSLPIWHTQILGHEFYGQIIELNTNSKHLSIGDQVVVIPLLSCDECDACKRGQENLCIEGKAIGRTIQGSFAEYVNVPITNMINITNDSPLDSYILADPLAVCIHAKNLINTNNYSKRCLIIGDGTIGCLLAWLLKKQGHEVWISGKHNESLDFIKAFDINIAKETPKQYFDVVFEAVGRSQKYSLDDCFTNVRWGGTVIVLGVFAQGYQYPLTARNLFIGEITVLGANAYTRPEFEEAVNMIKTNKQELNNFISHNIPILKFEEALEVAKNKPGYTMKIVLETEGLL